mmetsp:Transcript_51155/g.134733  ORF Transcript_51155/g.134733 Transcript_51155/m.134733 type:complete len:318 (+) Transcript_51155:1760-2713(+)
MLVAQASHSQLLQPRDSVAETLSPSAIDLFADNRGLELTRVHQVGHIRNHNHGPSDHDVVSRLAFLADLVSHNHVNGSRHRSSRNGGRILLDSHLLPIATLAFLATIQPPCRISAQRVGTIDRLCELELLLDASNSSIAIHAFEHPNAKFRPDVGCPCHSAMDSHEPSEIPRAQIPQSRGNFQSVERKPELRLLPRPLRQVSVNRLLLHEITHSVAEMREQLVILLLDGVTQLAGDELDNIRVQFSDVFQPDVQGMFVRLHQFPCHGYVMWLDFSSFPIHTQELCKRCTDHLGNSGFRTVNHVGGLQEDHLPEASKA